jgi:hypothetical protein
VPDAIFDVANLKSIWYGVLSFSLNILYDVHDGDGSIVSVSLSIIVRVIPVVTLSISSPELPD